MDEILETEVYIVLKRQYFVSALSGTEWHWRVTDEMYKTQDSLKHYTGDDYRVFKGKLKDMIELYLTFNITEKPKTI